MDFFDKNYLKIRNEHIIPKLEYGISRKKIEYWSFKEIITNRLISLTKLRGQTIEIELNIEDYYRALHCDIELFLNKTTIQYSDITLLNKTSLTWSFISIYYFAFFNATCLFRFLDNGFLFLSKVHCKRFEDFSSAVYSDSISLNSGNYYFTLKEINSYGNVVLILNSKNDSVHKSTWQLLENIFKKFSKNSSNDEKVVFDLFLDHFSKFKSEFPSEIRNKLNYNGVSSILDLEESIPSMKLSCIDSKFLKDLLKIDSNSSKYSEKMKSVTLLASYLFKLNTSLIQEFNERSIYGTDFKKERGNYLKKRNIKN